MTRLLSIRRSMHGSTILPGLSVRLGDIVSIRIGGRLLQSGKQYDDKPRRTVLSFNETPNFFEYSSSNPAQFKRENIKKNRAGARRLITSCPIFSQRSSAAKSADYTCFPAGSRRRTPFTYSPAPQCGVRYSIAVRCNSASLTLLPFPERFRTGCRRVQSLRCTVGPGSVFDIPAKPGVVKPGFFLMFFPGTPGFSAGV